MEAEEAASFENGETIDIVAEYVGAKILAAQFDEADVVESNQHELPYADGDADDESMGI